ncbi:MAG: metalloregulator ArsR/SmtB family transcription factor [Bacteroidota bacterium]
MGTTKTESFNIGQNTMANLAKAFAHPARIAIIEYLLKVNSCVCGDIVDELPLSQSTVSQHLKALKSAGIIMGNIEGTSVCYCIDRSKWMEAKKEFELLFNKLPEDFGCC